MPLSGGPLWPRYWSRRSSMLPPPPSVNQDIQTAAPPPPPPRPSRRGPASGFGAPVAQGQAAPLPVRVPRDPHAAPGSPIPPILVSTPPPPRTHLPPMPSIRGVGVVAPPLPRPHLAATSSGLLCPPDRHPCDPPAGPGLPFLPMAVDPMDGWDGSSSTETTVLSCFPPQSNPTTFVRSLPSGPPLQDSDVPALTDPGPRPTAVGQQRLQQHSATYAMESKASKLSSLSSLALSRVLANPVVGDLRPPAGIGHQTEPELLDPKASRCDACRFPATGVLSTRSTRPLPLLESLPPNSTHGPTQTHCPPYRTERYWRGFGIFFSSNIGYPTEPRAPAPHAAVPRRLRRRRLPDLNGDRPTARRTVTNPSHRPGPTPHPDPGPDPNPEGDPRRRGPPPHPGIQRPPSLPPLGGGGAG